MKYGGYWNSIGWSGKVSLRRKFLRKIWKEVSHVGSYVGKNIPGLVGIARPVRRCVWEIGSHTGEEVGKIIENNIM